jgi:glycosyltransferase involved in cell wall biosynthesis
MKIVFLATHPEIHTGYSKIANMITNYLADLPDVELTYICTSNTNPEKNVKRFIHPKIQMIDGVAESIKRNSTELYGINILEEVMYDIKPDIFFIYNDAIVTCRAYNALLKYRSEYMGRTKFISYLDIVYPHECQKYIQHINNNSDKIMVFTEYWKKALTDIGVPEEKIYVFYHGINNNIIYQKSKLEIRGKMNFDMKDFIILNTNRNSYRKGIDITIRAFLIFLKRENMNPNIKLYINFSLDDRYGYNILDVIDTECLRLGLLYHTVITNHIFHSQNHGMLTDEDINDLYNMSDVGINTCFGEGFGLCNAEQASLGIPQIISAVGGFTDIFEGEQNMLVQPVVAMRLPNHMDAVRGDLHICLAEHFADKLQYYYQNPDKRLEDGKRISKKINQRYDWKTLLPKMFAELQNIVTDV